MAKDTIELQSNPKYVTRIEKDKTQKRLERLEKRIEIYEKIGKLVDYAAPVLATVGGLGIASMGVAGVVGNISTVATVGSIALCAVTTTGSLTMASFAAKSYADYLNTLDR